MNRVSISLMTLSAFVLLACGKEEKKEEKKIQETAIPVKVAKVIPANFKEDITFYGTTRGVEEATLLAYESGKVQSVKVKEGDRVGAGKSLCNIEGALADKKVEMADVALKMAKDQLNAAENHASEGTGSQVQLDKAKLDVLQAEQNLILLKKNRRGAYCITPFAGVVAKVHIEKHEDINRGTPTITLIKDSQLKVRFGIPENQVQNFKRGKLVKVVNPLVEEKTVEVPIKALASVVAGSERTYQAEVSVSNQGNWFLPGQTALVKTFGIERENALVVPTSSILLRKKQGIVMVNEEMKAVAKNVSVVASNGTHSLVEGELKIGDELIVEGQAKVIEGSKLHLSKAKGQ